MDEQVLRMELMNVGNGRISPTFKVEEKAKLLVKYFLIKISTLSGVSIESLLADFITPEVKPVQNCTSSQDDVQNCTSKLRHTNSLPVEVYAEIDKMIKEGYTTYAITKKLGVHRNTISKRRCLLKGDLDNK